MDICTSVEVIRRIEAYANAQGWVKSRLAKEAALRDTTLRHFGKPEWNPTLRIIRQIEAIIPAEWKPAKPANSNRRGRG